MCTHSVFIIHIHGSACVLYTGLYKMFLSKAARLCRTDGPCFYRSLFNQPWFYRGDFLKPLKKYNMQKTLITTAGKNYTLDLKSNQLTFLDNRFYMADDGSFVPSVTTVLEAYPKTYAFYEWLKQQGQSADEVRDEAGRKGSVVHSLTERYDNGEEVNLIDDNGYIGYKLAEWAMFERWVEFRKRFDTQIIHNELNLVSKKYGIGGTVDRVMKMEEQLLLIDIKTSNALHPHYWLQLAAYRKMLEEVGITVDGMGILWLNAKTRTEGKKGQVQGKGWQLCTCNDEIEIEKYWQRFLACQQLWLAENGDQAPRQVSYSLTHKH